MFNNEQLLVVCNIIAAVESEGQVYHTRDTAYGYSNFTEAYTNSSIEHAITLSRYQFYATEALQLLKLIYSKDRSLFTDELVYDMNNQDWNYYNINKNSDKAKTIVKIISSNVGKECADELVGKQMQQYAKEAEALGVTDVWAQAMCANFYHHGGKSAMIRIINKTPKPYTLDNLYNASKSDTGNQVGAYRSRQDAVYRFIKQYLPKATINSSTTVINKGSDNMSKITKESAIDCVIKWLKSQVGYMEKASNAYLDDFTKNAGSGNYTKYWRDIYPSYQAQPWCACFVSWILMRSFGKETATKMLKHWPFVYCPTLGSLCTKYSTPEVGDIVLFYRNGEFAHTGMVIGVNGNQFTTIEGNTNNGNQIIANGGSVCSKQYYISNLPGTKFVRPDYSLVTSLNYPDGSSASAPSDNFLRQGSSGEEVRLMQKMLIACGYSCGSYGSDGNWGSATSSAVISFRKAHGLSADAVYDDKMRTVLQKAYSSIQEPEFQGGGKAEVDPADVITTDVFPKSMYIIKSPGKLRESAKKTGVLIMNIPAKEKVKVIKEKTNSAGNVWCKSQYTTGGKTYTGWIVKSNLTEKKPS